MGIVRFICNLRCSKAEIPTVPILFKLSVEGFAILAEGERGVKPKEQCL